MTVTYRDIWDKVSFYTKSEHKFFTSAEINSIITEDAFNRIAEEVGYPKANYSSYLTSGEWSVSSPSDFIKVDQDSQVTYKDATNTAVLTPTEQFAIGRDNILTATPGTPEHYFLESDTKIGIYPPSTSGCVVIPYVKRPTVMSSGDISTNELTERCYMAAVYWTVSELLIKDSDERASLFLDKYNAEIERLKSQYNMMLEIRRDMKPHKSYIQ
ncbi:MAG TPA: hypothetical protein VIY48_20790 [Candidatus Paceibacterota bacterium]